MEEAYRGNRKRTSRVARALRHLSLDSPPRFELMSEGEIVARAREGDEEAFRYLIKRYSRLIEAKTRSFFLAGADTEDLLQEALIGLFKAVRDYQEEKAHSFRNFAELCITRQITSAVRMATRQKHIPLNNYLPLGQSAEGEEAMVVEPVEESAYSNPEEHFWRRQICQELERSMRDDLTELERKVLLAHLEGKSYTEIARELRRHVKCVDNALQRARKKLDKNLRQFII